MTPPNGDRPRPARVQRTRLYEQIVEQLQAYIADNRLGPGDRLPAERELAHDLGVSRASVAQAVVALEVLGVISVRHGDGIVIARTPDDTLLTRLREHQDSLPDIIDARSALESRLAALAASRRTEEDLALIDASLEQMAAELASGKRGIEGDKAFHEAVTRAAHSALLGRLMGEIAQLVLKTRIESLSQPDRPEVSLENHREITEAIRAQDPASAAAAMERHIELVSDVALLTTPRPSDAEPRGSGGATAGATRPE